MTALPARAGRLEPIVLTRTRLLRPDMGQRTEDFSRCATLLRALSADADSVRLLHVEGEPRSKARPRFSGNGHVYSSTKQVEAERALGWRFRQSFTAPLDGNLAVACVFYRSTRGRVDVDNMLKHVMDAANKICWHDDYQVTAMIGVVELDRENPRTIIAIAPHESTMVRTLDRDRACVQCGKGFRLPFQDSPKRFCSTRCASLSVGTDLRAEVACRWCEKPFKRINAKQTYCTHECRLLGLHKKNLKRPVRMCAGCGVVLKNQQNAARCRACWKASRAKPSAA